jgi:hypothetical protein
VPAYGDLGRHIEQAESQRRATQEELDKLRRTSCGLRAEVAQLREVRGAIDALPPAPQLQPQVRDAIPTPRAESGSTRPEGKGKTEQLALLQRRLVAIAPQLVPLAARARAEMEELMRCCQRLEERQLRLEKVVPATEAESDSLGHVSCGSIFSASGARLRARSADDLARGSFGATAALPSCRTTTPRRRTSRGGAVAAAAGGAPASSQQCAPRGGGPNGATRNGPSSNSGRIARNGRYGRGASEEALGRFDAGNSVGTAYSVGNHGLRGAAGVLSDLGLRAMPGT